MSVFDGKTKIGRAVKEPGTDNTLPGGASLIYGAIAGPTALAGCTGIDAQLIHGDKWSENLGSHTEHVLQNVTLNVDGNQTIQVGANQTETICGSSSETLIGPHMVTNLSVFNETRIGPHVTTHGELEMLNDEDGKIHFGFRQYTFYVMTHEIEGVHFEFAPMHFEIKVNHFYLSGMDASAVITQYATQPINVEESATTTSVNALASKIEALEASVGVGAHAKPRANAAPTVSTSAPFGA